LRARELSIGIEGEKKTKSKISQSSRYLRDSEGGKKKSPGELGGKKRNRSTNTFEVGVLKIASDRVGSLHTGDLGDHAREKK